jgi:glycosyltransferase involved in cell wall biosynthesis
MRQNILFIASGWLQDVGGGGVKSVVTKLLNNFQNDSFVFSFLDIEIGVDRNILKTGHSGLSDNIKFISIYLPNIKIKELYIPIWPLFLFRVLLTIKKEKPKLICYITGPSVKVILFFLVKLFFPSLHQVFIEHIPPILYIEKTSHFRNFLKSLIYLFYRKADAIVSVSREMANNMIKELKISPEKMYCIYNPIVDSSLCKKSFESINHPYYFAKSAPIILSVDRLDPLQKDFSTLLKAFSLVIKKCQRN